MKWGITEKSKWLNEQKVQRSYQGDVVSRIRELALNFELIQYGALSVDPEKYPLFFLRSKNSGKKTVLVTGGVHGYETSGVHGALGFLEQCEGYRKDFDLVVAPCLSPWAYETVNRWNTSALDPNRSFVNASEAEESRLFLEAISAHGIKPFAHIDLHETTDTDNSIFRPALEQRDGVTIEFSEIPDGFYVVGDTENPQAEFQKAVIDAVRPVTHIAKPDADGNIIGTHVEQDGVINYPLKKLGLCTGFSAAEFTTTTEVYPDSPKATPAICIEAQIAAIRGALDFLRGKA